MQKLKVNDSLYEGINLESHKRTKLYEKVDMEYTYCKTKNSCSNTNKYTIMEVFIHSVHGYAEGRWCCVVDTGDPENTRTITHAPGTV